MFLWIRIPLLYTKDLILNISITATLFIMYTRKTNFGRVLPETHKGCSTLMSFWCYFIYFYKFLPWYKFPYYINNAPKVQIGNLEPTYYLNFDEVRVTDKRRYHTIISFENWLSFTQISRLYFCDDSFSQLNKFVNNFAWYLIIPC